MQAWRDALIDDDIVATSIGYRFTCIVADVTLGDDKHVAIAAFTDFNTILTIASDSGICYTYHSLYLAWVKFSLEFSIFVIKAS